MPRKPKCKYCGRIVSGVSTHGLCPACQIRKCKTSVRQLRTKKGKYYKTWKLNLLDAVKNQPM